MNMSFSADCWAPSSGISLHGIPAFLQVPPHALMGGYAGAAIAKGGFGSILYSGWTMTLVFIVLAPLIGMLIAFVMRVILMWIFNRNHRQRSIALSQASIVVSGALQFGHGTTMRRKQWASLPGCLFHPDT